MYWLKSPALLLSLLLHTLPFTAQTVTASVAATSTSDSASSSSREPITRTVQVAKGGHTFVPDVVQAKVGDFVEFRFFPTNHSVVRAAYEYPCIPYDLVETDKAGFSSGFRPVDAILDNPPIFEIRINDTDPVFYYCSAPASCIKYQMVGVINPSASTSLQVQRDMAENSTFMLQPGEQWPDEASSPSEVGAGPPPSQSDEPSQPASTPTQSATPSPALSPGGIAGVAIGGAVVILLAAVLIYFCGRDRALSPFGRPKRNTALPGDFETSGVQYVQAIPKHQSGMTTASSMNEPAAYLYQSPALSGYNGTSERIHVPPRAHYPPSDALSPATGTMRSSSPGSTVVPAYSKSPTIGAQSHFEHAVEGVHEMDAGGGAEMQRSGGMRKGGVERYT